MVQLLTRIGSRVKRRQHSLATVLFACGVALLNCSAGCLFYSACNLPVVFPGVYVQVLDDQTGQGITNAVVTVAAGQYSETLSAVDAEGNYVGGYGLTGTLSLTVEAPGFVSQQIDDVFVEALPDCQIKPANLTVRLTPTS